MKEFADYSFIFLTNNFISNFRTNAIFAYNVFGTWDACIWFDAENHDKATDFIVNKIRPISGVLETYTMPTTPIKEYKGRY